MKKLSWISSCNSNISSRKDNDNVICFFFAMNWVLTWSFFTSIMNIIPSQVYTRYYCIQRTWIIQFYVSLLLHLLRFFLSTQYYIETFSRYSQWHAILYEQKKLYELISINSHYSGSSQQIDFITIDEENNKKNCWQIKYEIIQNETAFPFVFFVSCISWKESKAFEMKILFSSMYEKHNLFIPIFYYFEGNCVNV